MPFFYVNHLAENAERNFRVQCSCESESVKEENWNEAWEGEEWNLGASYLFQEVNTFILNDLFRVYFGNDMKWNGKEGRENSCGNRG